MYINIPMKYQYIFLQGLYSITRVFYLFQSVRFLSDIGGAMGLFMGASVLSCVELLQLLLEILLYMRRRFTEPHPHTSAVHCTGSHGHDNTFLSAFNVTKQPRQDSVDITMPNAAV